MLKNFLKFTCAALIFLSGTAWLDATSLTLKAVPKQTTAALSSTLTVTQTSSTTATMSWNMAGTAPYQVIVRNLSTGQSHTSFSTNNSSANITGLTPGNLYRFEVTSSAETLIIELVVTG